MSPDEMYDAVLRNPSVVFVARSKTLQKGQQIALRSCAPNDGFDGGAHDALPHPLDEPLHPPLLRAVQRLQHNPRDAFGNPLRNAFCALRK
jgi:hypothetical protein